MSDSLVTFSIDDGIARIALNRPDKRNALTRELIAEFSHAIEDTADDDSVRLLIVSANGPAFCAGMDLDEMQQRAALPDASAEWQRDTQVFRDLIASLVWLPVPTLAVVQGAALAGGFGLVLACDMVLAAETAVFVLPEPKRGITAAVVAPLLIYRVGVGQAGYLLLSGRNISAREAHRIGICHEVVPADSLSAREHDLTRSILTGAPSALRKTKQLILDTAATHLAAQLDVGMTVSAQARETADAREGLSAFLDKRTPRWTTD
ncbi:MAG: enoyl-CoA hydratase-related protein [Planctomycetaceae bacterium]